MNWYNEKFTDCKLPLLSIQADFLVSSQFSFSSTDMETIAAYRNITNLRLTLVEPTILSDYELTEWKVIGSCMCNGHSSLCTPMFGESIAEDKVCSFHMLTMFSGFWSLKLIIIYL